MKLTAPRKRIVDKMRQGWQLCVWHNSVLGNAYSLHIGHQVPITVTKADYEWLCDNDVIYMVKRTVRRMIYELTEVPSDV